MSVTEELQKEIEKFFSEVHELPLTSDITPAEIKQFLRRYDFCQPVSIDQVFHDVIFMMRAWNAHSNNPRHLGLFRPGTDLSSVIGDALAALYNPQLATWDLAPAANEIEQYTLNVISKRFGFDSQVGIANFTSGGSEANQTAVIAALTHRFPEYGTKGVRGIVAQPIIYLSEEAHHSFEKIAHISGLGREALRVIPTDTALRMDMQQLNNRFKQDLAAGNMPLMVVGTAGTTNAGVIDPLDQIAGFCRTRDVWFHADAAWGGAAALSDRLRPELSGIELADSLTFDAHKWLSASAATGTFFCKHRLAVMQAFSTEAAYVPERQNDGRVYPFLTTMQWGRRFTGLKVFIMLAELGLPGIAARLEHQAEIGEYLRDELMKNGWRVLNKTALPVVCFNHPRITEKHISLDEMVSRLASDQVAWISRTHLQNKIPCLRACVTNFRTQRQDIDVLVEALNGIVS
jgi:aromatic-L-amino-acid/L-tryptophan decarboxylase